MAITKQTITEEIAERLDLSTTQAKDTLEELLARCVRIVVVSNET